MLCAIILGSILIVLFHFGIGRRRIIFRRATIPYFLFLILVVFRVILPIDSDVFIVLRSKHVFTALNNFLRIQVYKSITIENVLYSIWCVGAIISLWRWNRAIKIDSKNLKILRNTSKKINGKYSYITEKVGLDSNRVYISDKVDEVITTGIKDYMIFLPKMDYADNDLLNILSHEASHIEHADILIRMILHVFSCIFWWNPLFKLFERDYVILMEYRCDECAVKYCTIAEKVDYVETLKRMAIVKADFVYRYMEAGFAVASEKSSLILRARRVLEIKQANHRIIMAIGALELVLFVLSYFVIIQPFYDPNDIHIEGELTINSNNAFLVKKDSNYRLYIYEDDWGIISQDEINMEPYCRLEIRR